MSNLINAQSGVKIRPNTSTSDQERDLVIGSPTHLEMIDKIPLSEREKSYDNNTNTYSQLNVTGALLMITSSPEMTLIHSDLVPNNKPYYMKVDFQDRKILESILGGYVGNFLNNVVSAILGGIANTKFTLYNNDVNVFEGGTHAYSGVSLSKMRFVQDKNSDYFVRFTPGVNFNKIKVYTDQGGVISTSKWTRIYDAFYYDSIGDCPEIYTYVNASEDLLTAVGSSPPVSLPSNAIDNNINSYSSFGNKGLINLGVGKTIEQIIELPAPTNQKKVQIKLQMPSKLLNVGVASGIKVIFYNGQTQLSEINIDRSILSLDVLGLINDGNNTPFSITLDPPGIKDANNNITGIMPFDRIGIKVTQPINVDVATISGDLNIYDVAFVDLEPENRVVCTKTFEIAGGGYEKKFDITQLISGFDPAKFAQYHIVDDKHRLVKFDSQADIDTKKWQPLGQYLIKGIDAPNFCIDQYYTYIAVQDNQYTISGKAGQTVLVNNELDFSKLVYTSNLPNGGAAQIYDESNNQIVTNSKKAFDQLGTFNYYVKVTNSSGTCDIIKRIKVYVYDTLTCDYRYVKRHATSEDVGTASLLGIPLGGSSESERAVDADFSTNSTIFNVISLLGIGTTWQDLKFSTPITAGTPVTIKLGQEYSVLQLIGAITIRPLDAQGNAIGKLKGIGETDLLNALVGDNIFEFSFTPTDNNGVPIDYSGVRVHLGSLLGVGNSMSIYGAYVDERLAATSSTCVSNLEVNGATIPKILNVDTYLANTDTNVPGFDVLTAVGSLDGKVKLSSTTQDVLWGVKDPGIGVATSLSGVIYPYLAADHSYETVDINNNPITVDGLKSFAIFNTAAAVLNAQTLTVKFKEIARPGDKVRIVMGSQNVGVLNLDLLKNFTIQRYSGDVPVGDVITNSQFSIINLNILGLLGDVKNKYAVIIDDSKVPFDRIELKYTNLVSVQLLGNYTYVYDISLIPYLEFGDNQTDVNICLDKVFEVEKSEICTQYGLSFAYKKLVEGSSLSDPVYEWIEIPASQLNLVYENQEIYRYKIPNVSQLKSIFETHLNESIDNINGNLYIKVLTTRQGCLFGEAQYLKVNSIQRCNGMISNPMIRTRLKSY